MNVALKSTNVLTKGTSNLITVNQVGNGLLFDGVDDYTATPYNSAFNFTVTDSFSIACWVSLSSTKLFHTVFFKGGMGANGYYFGLSATTINFNTNEYSPYKEITYVANFNTNINQLVFLTGTYANKVMKIYANGVEIIGSYIGTQTNNIDGITGFDLGRYTNSPLDTNLMLNGIIYDLKLFNKTLNLTEITQLYTSFNNNVTGLTSNLVIDNNFNQKSGTVIEDKSTNNLNGTLTNFGATSNLGGGAWKNSIGNTVTY
jgi:sialidase-1